MHTVTKILVVFAAILAVMLAALTMAYSVNASAIKDGYRAAEDKAKAAEAAQQTAQAQFNSRIAEMQSRSEKAESSKGELENQIRALQAEKGKLVADMRAVEADRDSIRSMIAQSITTSETQANLNKSYSEEVTKLRERELAHSRKEIELTDRLNDLESQLEVSQAGVRALREQLAEANRSLQSAGGVRIGDTATNAGEPYRPVFALNGKVTRIDKDVSGKNLAQINIGSNNQVRENMKLSIVRGGKFIADMVVVKTDLQTSVGHILPYVGQTETVQPGDVVTSLASK